MPRRLDRRQFLEASLRASTRVLGASALVFPFAGLTPGCSSSDSERYTEQDAAALDAQREDERKRSGRGPFGPHRYRGYRGLAELPFFEVDPAGRLRLVDDAVPAAIDLHAHLGISVLFEPALDLEAPTDRVRHLLDCDAPDPGCDLDLDVYVNANFDESALRTLQWTTVTQGLWGNDFIRSHTIPNLLAEMDTMRVERSVILPIAMGFPFGDDLAAKWQTAIDRAGVAERLLAGASVHPRDPDKIAQLEAAAASGARVLKLHPTVQAFYPDDEGLMEVYEAAERLGLVVFFHGGRAGIEPESRHRYALPRHYEAAFASFPGLPFVVGHAGARDGEAMLELGLRYDNVWLGIHGQGITHLDRMIGRTRGERLLFGTDWPFYHLAASLAKVLIVTDTPKRAGIRHAILRGNAERLLA